ncbi:MAG: HD domain-containing protein [Ruminococcaceae bacterium]|nr:HD domain-containing protein [Oscillospiraceae bacterium]
MTYEEIRARKDIRTYITAADAALLTLGYTEHSIPHVTRVAGNAGKLLEALGYSARVAELARIAGYLHDIGNLINRIDHSQSGAVMAFRILDKLGFSAHEIATVSAAIGNHDEGTGGPVSPVAAALILADKSDVRRTRVRNRDTSSFDIHDRVNYSVLSSSLKLSRDHSQLLLSLSVDTRISPVMDYFEIFLDRMILCRKAAQSLSLRFRLLINGHTLL